MLDLGLNRKAAPTTGGQGFIRETDTARFEQDVLQASLQKPVIVDFWAPWCGPCRQLMPLLEKLVTEATGAIDLVKVNIDSNPDLAAALRVQSVPTVYAFFQGQPVDGFMGARPESELRAFLEKLKKLAGVAAPAPQAGEADVSALMETAEKFFQAGQYHDAMAAYSTVLDADPEHAAALGGIGWSLVALRDMAALGDFLSDLPPELKGKPELKGLVFLRGAAEESSYLPPETELAARAAAEPKNPQAAFDLGRRLMGEGDLEGAIDALVQSLRADRNWQEKAAQTLLLGLFDAMGPSHPLTSRGRRKLSALLFS